MRRLIFGSLILGFCSAAWAQAWPAKPVRVLVGFAPGGTTEEMGRRMDAEIRIWSKAAVEAGLGK